ncbi:MAG: hypothetical protein O9331_11910 [Acidovorax sp.]|nr:hypothetical protein [Acidovorax sp.]
MAQAPADPAAVCQRAADKLQGLVPQWRDFVVEFKAEANNPSVLALAEEHRQGRLKASFRRHCQREWGTHQAIFVCFSGSVTELGLALCMQKDTNPHGWEYRP